jgi:hypothetical protein
MTCAFEDLPVDVRRLVMSLVPQSDRIRSKSTRALAHDVQRDLCVRDDESAALALATGLRGVRRMRVEEGVTSAAAARLCVAFDDLTDVDIRCGGPGGDPLAAAGLETLRHLSVAGCAVPLGLREPAIRLRDLETLVVEYARPFPVEHLGLLGALRELTVTLSGAHGVLPELSTRLTRLVLRCNPISDFASVALATSLQHLHLGAILHDATLPETLDRLVGLRDFVFEPCDARTATPALPRGLVKLPVPEPQAALDSFRCEFKSGPVKRRYTKSRQSL